MKRALILCVCLLLVATAAQADHKPGWNAKRATEVMRSIGDPHRDYFEGFEISVPPPGWTAIANNTYTWEVGTYSPFEGLQNAVCYYDGTYSGPQDEWICFEYTLEAGDDCLCFQAYGSPYWAIDPYQNYNIHVKINGSEVWNYVDDSVDPVMWQWQESCVSLDAYSPGQTLDICLGYTGYDGAEGAFDAIFIGDCGITPPEPCCPFDVVCVDKHFNTCDQDYFPIPCGVGPIPWEYGVPVGIPGVSCDDVPVTHVLATILNGDYPVAAGQGAVVGPFDITAECSCLEICHFYDIEPGYDGGNVKVSTDGGATWTLVYPFRGYDDILDSTSFQAECVWMEEVFTGHQTEFVRDCFDLSDYIGQTVHVGLFFGADGSVTYPGWYVKWIRLGGDEMSPVQQSTWGKIKSNFRSMFRKN